MIKKIIFILMVSYLLFSCGIKDDPEYKSNKNNILTSRV
tara:strand:+ start:53 stop:169 length:117 start_codon:yes stop_codon:yes gene_type:complete